MGAAARLPAGAAAAAAAAAAAGPHTQSSPSSHPPARSQAVSESGLLHAGGAGVAPALRTREQTEQLQQGADWLPLRRARSPLPAGLPPAAAERIRAFEAALPCVLHEDTTRVLALPADLGGFGFRRLTAVQARVMPVLAQGADALVRARTGTGKTMAYLAPLL